MEKAVPLVSSLLPLGGGAIAGGLLSNPEDNFIVQSLNAQRIVPRLQPPPPAPRQIPNLQE